MGMGSCGPMGMGMGGCDPKMMKCWMKKMCGMGGMGGMEGMGGCNPMMMKMMGGCDPSMMSCNPEMMKCWKKMMMKGGMMSGECDMRGRSRDCKEKRENSEERMRCQKKSCPLPKCTRRAFAMAEKFGG